MSLIQSVCHAWSAFGWCVTWQFAILALLAWLCQRLLRVRQPAARHALWWFVLIAPLALAPLRLALARQDAAVVLSVPAPTARGMVRTQMVRFAPHPVSLPADGASAILPGAGAAPIGLLPRPEVRTAPTSLWRGLGLAGLAAVLWMVGCAAAVTRLLLGHRWVRAMLRESAPVADVRLLTALRDLCMEAGVATAVVLRSSAAISAPVLYGWTQPTVVLPGEWPSVLSGEEIQSFLAHEVAHIKRHDFAINVVQQAVAAPLFYHPAVWLANRHIGLAREQMCDAWALRHGTDPAPYAKSLAAAASRADARLAPASVGVAERRSTLRERVEAIMDTGSGKRLSRRPALVLAAVLLLSAAALSAVRLSAAGDSSGSREATAAVGGDASGGSAAAVVGGGRREEPAAGRPDVVRASRFELVDRDGNLRAMWYMARGGGQVMWMQDRKGVKCAQIEIAAGKSESVTLFDAEGKPALRAGVADDGRSKAVLIDKQGRGRAAVSLDTRGTPHLLLGPPHVRLYAGSAAAPPPADLPQAQVARGWQFEMVDDAGHIRGKWYFDPEAGSGLAFWDNRGVIRIVLGEGLTLFDSQGRMAAWAGIAGDGNPKVVLLDQRGRWRAGLALDENGTPLALWDQVGTPFNGPSGPAERGTAAAPPEWVVRGPEAAGSPQEGLVEARQFELVDASGNLRGKWYHDPKGSTGLAMWSGKGTMRLLLDLGQGEGEGLTLFDEKGKMAAWAGVANDGYPKSVLLDTRGRWRASVSLSSGGTPTRLWNVAGVTRSGSRQGR